MNIQQLLEEAKTWSVEERKEVIARLVQLDNDAPPKKNRRITELRGLGKELWQGIDAQEYINQLRDEWNTKS